MQVLQEQIKPHFLYNTFDTIHWIAKKYGAAEIVEIVKSLTTMLRIGLSRGRDVITLQSEINHAVSYLTIQHIRYGDKLSYRIIAPETDCGAYYVQKLILQPIIENALYHGIKNRRGNGRMLVCIQIKPDRIVLSVTDNGPDIAKERLQTIRESLENNNRSHSGYGLFNVHERIRISYGPEYGIRIFTRPGYYTRMEIHHPLITLPEEADDE